MAQKSNRYPERQVARDYRRDRPVRRYPTPDNDNKPGWRPPKRPLPLIPANDNRPVPKVDEWSFSKPPKIPGWMKYIRRVLRLHPLIGTALTLWELYDLYQWYMSQGAEPGGYWFCRARQRPGTTYGYYRDHTTPTRPAVTCSTASGWPTSVGWHPNRPWYVEYELDGGCAAGCQEKFAVAGMAVRQ